MKTIIFVSILLLVLAVPNFSQTGSINNTLGAGGSFVIKDGAETFLNLDQDNGYLNLSKSLNLLETSGAAIGVIYKGVNRFIHNYTPTGADGFNTFVGVNSGNFTMSGTGLESSNNTAVGHSTLKSLTTGSFNSAFGMFALTSNTTGQYNSAFGYSTLRFNTTGYYNSAFGYEALYSNTFGINNSAFGRSALNSNTDGESNSAFGYSALSNTTGNHNSAFGMTAGNSLTTGSNNTIIGNGAQPSAVDISNEITLGNTSIATLRCNVQTISALSDRRDKKNIKYLPLGLDFLMKVKPRLFNWDRREWYEDGISDGSKMNKTPTAGFIAQELDSVQINTGVEWLNLVLKTNPERIEATPGNLFPIVVKAIHDLKFENDALAKENKKLQNELEILRASIADVVKVEVKAAFLRAVGDKESAAKVSLLGSTD